MPSYETTESQPAARCGRPIALGLAAVMGWLCGPFASAVLPVGTLVQDGPPTPEQISLMLPLTGALDFDATATVRYRPVSSSDWIEGHPLYRIRTDFTTTSGIAPGLTVDDGFAWPIIDLSPGATYEVEVTVSDGNETEVRTGTFSTRALPDAAGAVTTVIPATSSQAQIQSFFNDASPGDVLQFQNGTYDLGGNDIEIRTLNGTENNPIYIRGESRDGVILRNAAPRTFYFVEDTTHVVFEDMTLEGRGVDQGITGRAVIQFFQDSESSSHLTFRRLTIIGHDLIIKTSGSARFIESMLIYDNTFLGNNQWEQDLYASSGSGDPGAGDGTRDVAQNLFWNDDGVNISGFGHAVFNNTFRGFGDTMSFCTHSGSNATAECRAIHFYRNDVYESGDDCAEMDYAFRNVSLYDNRCTNAMTAVSLDNSYGGPYLMARNTFVNIGRSPYKFNGNVSGMFIYHHTVVRTANDDLPGGWYQSGASGTRPNRAWGYRNSIFITQNLPGNQRPYWNETRDNNPIDFSDNSWFPDGRYTWNNSGGSSNHLTLSQAFANLSATTPVFGTQTQRHANDNIIAQQPFAATLTLGSNFLSEFTGTPDVTLASGTAASNSGVAVPNISDGFSGSAPDRGAVISGRPTVTYGDPTAAGVSPPVVDLSVAPATVNSGDTAQLTWSTQDATSCEASGGWSGARATSNASGEETSALTVDTQFILTCAGPGGSGSDSVSVTVTGGNPVPTVTFNANPTSVVSGETTLLTWSSTDADSCTASGGPADNSWSGTRATENLAGETSSALSANTLFTLTCSGPGGTDAASAQVTVSNPPPPAPTVSLSANPTSVTSGDSTTLTWSTTNADSCEATGGWSGGRGTSNSTGEVSPALTENTLFTLACEGPGGFATDSVNITVTSGPPPPTISLTATPDSIISGNTTLLTWTTTDADSCTAADGPADGSWDGGRATQNLVGESSSVLTASTTFTLNCVGPGGSSGRSIQVTVTNPPPTVSLAASPAMVSVGETTNLTWSSTNATSCEASGGWSGPRATSNASGEVSSALTGTTSFTLTCSGPGGSVSDSVTVAVDGGVPRPQVTFIATPGSVVIGETTLLTWTSTDADSCSTSGGPPDGSWTGSRPTDNQAGETSSALNVDTLFVLNCTGPGGVTVATVFVTVTDAPPPPPTVSLVATPSTVVFNESATLTWSTTDADTCTAGGGWSGAQSLNNATGETTGALTDATTFTLTCSNASGSTTDTVVVTVEDLPLPQVAINPSATSVDSGGDVTLGWTVQDAVICQAGNSAGRGDWFGRFSIAGGSLVVENITSSTAFSLSCANAQGGSSGDSVTIMVNDVLLQPSVTLDATPNPVDSGGDVTLTWSSENVDTCEASGDWSGSVGTSGTFLDAGLTMSRSYVLTCDGPNGGDAAVANVTVNPVDPNDTDGDGLEDAWEISNFGNLDQGPNDDPDNDGVSNADEFAAGTDPLVDNTPEPPPTNGGGGGGGALGWLSLWLVCVLRRRRIGGALAQMRA